MSHVYAICLASDADEADAAMTDSVGHGWDYFSDLEPEQVEEMRQFKTVWDLVTLTDKELVGKFYCIVTDSDCYRNQYNVMTDEQLAELFRKVLKAYGPDQGVVIYDVHI